MNGPSRARRHRGTPTRSLFPEVSVKIRLAPIAGAHYVSEEEIFGRLFALSRTFHRSTRMTSTRTRSSPASVYYSDAGEPTCTTIESKESSAVIGESGMRGGGDDLSSIIRADQLTTKSSPGSNVASPISSQSACGYWNGLNPGVGTIDSSLVSCTFGYSFSSIMVVIGLSAGVSCWSAVGRSISPAVD